MHTLDRRAPVKDRLVDEDLALDRARVGAREDLAVREVALAGALDRALPRDVHAELEQASVARILGLEAYHRALAHERPNRILDRVEFSRIRHGR